MLRTNVVLDEKLVKSCQKLTGIKTKRALLDHALRVLARQQNQKKLLELEGNVQWEGDLDEWRKGRGADR